jgi:hypothetical protein
LSNRFKERQIAVLEGTRGFDVVWIIHIIYVLRRSLPLGYGENAWVTTSAMRRRTLTRFPKESPAASEKIGRAVYDASIGR